MLWPSLMTCHANIMEPQFAHVICCLIVAISVLFAAGAVPVCVYYSLWLVCNTHLSEHRTFGWCCGSTHVLQLDGVSINWTCHAPSTKEYTADCIHWRHDVVFDVVEALDVLSSEPCSLSGPCY